MELEVLQKAFYKAKENGDKVNARRFAQALVDFRSTKESEDGARSMSTMETLEGQMKNIPSSAMRLIGDLTYPLRHPVDFNKSVTNLGMGIYQKFTDGVQPQEKDVDAMVGYGKDRFGGWDNIKRTAYKDPIGFAADLAGLAVLRPIAKAAAQPRNARRVLSGVKDRLLYKDDYPTRSYKSISKSTFKTKNLDKKINTVLDEQLLPFSEGVDRLESVKDGLNKNISSLISSSTKKGEKIPYEYVLSDIESLRISLGKATKTDGLGNLDKIDAVVDKIKGAAEHEGRLYYSVAEMQQLKKDLYKNITHDIKQQKAETATNAARKNIARNAKERIEGFVPETKGMNKRLGGLYGVEADLVALARRIEGRNNVGIGSPINMMAAASAGVPFMFANPTIGSAISAVGMGGSLINSYRHLPKNLANRAFRVHISKKGNLKNDLSSLGLLGELDRLNISREVFLQGLLQTSRESETRPK